MNVESTQDTSEFNVIFVHSSLDDYPLTPEEFRVYAHIARRAGSGEFWESHKNAAKRCGMGEDRYKMALKNLVSFKMLEAKARVGKTNLYHLTKRSTWVSEADVEKFHSRAKTARFEERREKESTRPPRNLPPGDSTPSTPPQFTPEGEGAIYPPKGNPLKGSPSKGNPNKTLVGSADERGPKIDFQAFVDLWHEKAPKLPSVASLNDERKKLIRRVVKDAGSVEQALETFGLGASYYNANDFALERRHTMTTLLRHVFDAAEAARDSLAANGRVKGPSTQTRRGDGRARGDSDVDRAVIAKYRDAHKYDPESDPIFHQRLRELEENPSDFQF